MRIVETNLFKKLIADEGKQLRSINDVYEKSYVDENGNEIEEHYPSYSTTIFLPKNINDNDILNMYVEE